MGKGVKGPFPLPPPLGERPGLTGVSPSRPSRASPEAEKGGTHVQGSSLFTGKYSRKGKVATYYI